MLVRTVTRAFARTWMPSFATAATSLLPLAGSGQSITFGVTLGARRRDVAASEVDARGGLEVETEARLSAE